MGSSQILGFTNLGGLYLSQRALRDKQIGGSRTCFGGVKFEVSPWSLCVDSTPRPATQTLYPVCTFQSGEHTTPDSGL